MLVKYSSLTTVTIANLLSDLKYLFTNTAPDINSLSAGCDKSNSQIIINQAITNWTLHDDVPASGYFVIKSPSYDGGMFKYIQVVVTLTSVQLRCFESWNATTHVGTNEALGASAQQMSATGLAWNTGGTGYFAIKNSMIMVSNPAGTSGGMVMELTREIPGQLDLTYPSTISFDHSCQLTHSATAPANLQYGFKVSRYRRPDTGVSTTATGNYFNFNGTPIIDSVANQFLQNTGGGSNTDGISRYMYTDFYICVNLSNTLGPLGRPVSDILLLPYSSLTYTVFDEITINGKIYVAGFKGGDQTLLLILKE